METQNIELPVITYIQNYLNQHDNLEQAVIGTSDDAPTNSLELELRGFTRPIVFYSGNVNTIGIIYKRIRRFFENDHRILFEPDLRIPPIYATRLFIAIKEGARL